MSKICGNCGSKVDDKYHNCPTCGANLPYSSVSQQTIDKVSKTDYNYTETDLPKSRKVAALLALFTGILGIHNFYLGYYKKAMIQLILGVVTFGFSGIWGFLEGILIIFEVIKVDGKGRPLV